MFLATYNFVKTIEINLFFDGFRENVNTSLFTYFYVYNAML